MVLKSDAVLEQWKAYLKTDAGKEITRKIGLIFQLNISTCKIGLYPETYIVDLKQGEIMKGTYPGMPDAVFSLLDDDFVKIATGKINPQLAAMRGAMKVQGSTSAAQMFTADIFPKPARM